MKKLLLGILLLSVMFCSCLANNVYLNMELSVIKTTIQQSVSASEAEAADYLKLAYKRYRDSQVYAEVVLPDAKSEALGQLFIDALSSPGENTSKNHLIYLLDGIMAAEKLSIGSVF